MAVVIDGLVYNRRLDHKVASLEYQERSLDRNRSVPSVHRTVVVNQHDIHYRSRSHVYLRGSGGLLDSTPLVHQCIYPPVIPLPLIGSQYGVYVLCLLDRATFKVLSMLVSAYSFLYICHFKLLRQLLLEQCILIGEGAHD